MNHTSTMFRVAIAVAAGALMIGATTGVAAATEAVAPSVQPLLQQDSLRSPVDVTRLQCDGDTYTCTANLRFGDGKWVARWNSSVFHQATTAEQRSPVDVTRLQCDGDTYTCTANLRFGDGKWVARWNSSVFHQS